MAIALLESPVGRAPGRDTPANMVAVMRRAQELTPKGNGRVTCCGRVGGRVGDTEGGDSDGSAVAVAVAAAIAVAALIVADADADADTDATLAIATAAIAPGAREVPVRRQPPVLRRQWLVLSVLYITPLGLSSVQGYVRGTTS